MKQWQKLEAQRKSTDPPDDIFLAGGRFGCSKGGVPTGDYPATTKEQRKQRREWDSLEGLLASQYRDRQKYTHQQRMERLDADPDDTKEATATDRGADTDNVREYGYRSETRPDVPLRGTDRGKSWESFSDALSERLPFDDKA